MCVNKNGHDKKNPRLDLSPKHVPDHPILYAVYTLFRAAVVKLFLRPRMFPSLRTPSGKKKKSDRMEAICLTLLAMVVCMDLRALLAATPVDEIKRDSWLGRSITKLAEIAGISYWRCKRAIGDMRDASFIGIWRVTVESEGQKKGRPSLRRLPEDFIKALGIWRPFGKLRKLYDQMVKEANEDMEEAQEAVQKLARLPQLRPRKPVTC